MNYEQALTYIHSICWKGSVPGLGRTQELLARMGNPEKKLKFVHIAGTNGKGSTASMTASILRKAGYRTGLYTSPFIFRFNERMGVDGQDIPDDMLAEITEFVKPHADAMTDRPTEFELVTAIAMEYFARMKCDIVCLEVGLGGELDSTNVIDPPEVAVLCNLGLEHTAVLGHTIEEIAAAKAGIVKKGCHVAVYRNSANVEAVYEAKAAEVGAAVHYADFDSIVLHEHSFAGQKFDCMGYKDLFLPLLGEHQLKNAAVVLTAVECLRQRGWKISDENVCQGITSVSWPGRFEVLSRDPDFIVDGGHNPQCLEALAKNVEDYLADREITALVGVMADKDYAAMFASMAPYITRFVTVTPENPRAMKAPILAANLGRFGKPATACDSVREGVETALEYAKNGGIVLAFGSLYMVGDIRDAVMAVTKN